MLVEVGPMCIMEATTGPARRRPRRSPSLRSCGEIDGVNGLRLTCGMKRRITEAMLASAGILKPGSAPKGGIQRLLQLRLHKLCAGARGAHFGPCAHVAKRMLHERLRGFGAF